MVSGVRRYAVCKLGAAYKYFFTHAKPSSVLPAGTYSAPIAEPVAPILFVRESCHIRPPPANSQLDGMTLISDNPTE